MRVRDLVMTGAAGSALVIGMAACGGSGGSSSTVALNGEQNKTATQILADSRAAVATATSLRFVGTDPESSPPLLVNLSVSSNHSGTASVRQDGQTIDLARVGSTGYLRANESFYTKNADVPAGVATLLADRWVKFSSSDPSYKDFSKMLDLKAFSAEILTPTHTVTKAGQGTVRGTRVIYLDDGTEDKVAISLEGKPYPLAFTSAGKTVPIATMTWDTPVKVTAPTGALDFSKVAG